MSLVFKIVYVGEVNPLSRGQIFILDFSLFHLLEKEV